MQDAIQKETEERTANAMLPYVHRCVGGGVMAMLSDKEGVVEIKYIRPITRVN